MTEAEWLNATDPRQMLEYLRGNVSDRKLRLFGAACCRLVWDALPDAANRDLIVAVEDYPDGKFEDPVLDDAITASSAGEGEWGEKPSYWAVKRLGRSYYKLLPQEAAEVVTYEVVHCMGDGTGAAIADFFRDISGNPFRPIVFDPAWCSETVVALANGIYADRAFDRMPILADALQEAGCDNTDILNHCRGAGPHVRGCWVIDLVLGKV
jgi:hypothetical protein